jgi:hypothetical protein
MQVRNVAMKCNVADELAFWVRAQMVIRSNPTRRIFLIIAFNFKHFTERYSLSLIRMLYFWEDLYSDSVLILWYIT